MSLDHTHILVVDDDTRLRTLLGQFLRGLGWQVTLAEDAMDAAEKLTFFTVDLMVLDVMMPGISGVEFAQKIHEYTSSPPPILMLTAMGEAQDRIVGLEAGVDDYLSKPFEPRELELRIRRILKHTQALEVAAAKPESSVVRFGGFTFDVATERLTQKGERLYLTESETALLSTLAAQAGEVVSRESLAEQLGERIANERSVDVQINRLRKKIESDPSRPHFIQTVRGAGYVLRASEAAKESA